MEHTYAKPTARVPAKRRRIETTDDDDGQLPTSSAAQQSKDMLEEMSSLGTGNPHTLGQSGSAWDGQMKSLATDNFTIHDFTSMRNDVYQKITTSSHIMAQGGAICSNWTRIPGISDVLNISMGHMTGNTMMGSANMFNQYFLCKLLSFKVIFKDIVVALEASSSVGLQLMSDVITEWRRRPQAEYLSPQPVSPGPGDTGMWAPDQAEYPDWWGDWRPATDGAVEFTFHPHTREVPAFLANVMRRGPPPINVKDPASYATLGQFMYGDTKLQQYSTGATLRPGDRGPTSQTGAANYHPYATATPHNWMDFFFEWRARNCPNSTSATNTSALYNVQIDCVWQLAYRTTALTTANNNTFTVAAAIVK